MQTSALLRTAFKTQTKSTLNSQISLLFMKTSFSQSLVVTLLWSAVTPILVTAQVVVPNDDFASATLISGSSGTTSGDNTGATQETEEPEFLKVNGDGRSIWWRWIAPESTRYQFDTTGSGRDTILGVYQGTTLVDLAPLLEIDDGATDSLESKGAFVAVAGTEYFIAVDIFFEDEPGTITLNWSPKAAPVLTMPTMVYNLRRVFTEQGLDNELPSEETPFLRPRSTSVMTGLVVRGRSESTTFESGNELGPVAVIETYTKRVGRTLTKYYKLIEGVPNTSESIYFGMAASLIRVGTRSINVFETAFVSAESDLTSERVNIAQLKGQASLSKILASQQAPVWFARKLTASREDYFSFEFSETLAQGQPIEGTYVKESSTLTFNATESRALAGIDFFEEIVAAVIARLEAKGYQSSLLDVE